MDRRTYLRTAGLAGVATVAGCLDSRAAGDSEYDVGMSTVAFKPETVTVAVGEEVVWRNTSKQGHTVTARQSGIPEGAKYFASGGFENESAARTAWMDGFGGRIAQGETFAHTFDVADEYHYFCIPHERAGMVGTVVVEE
jgi:plastocyanin